MPTEGEIRERNRLAQEAARDRAAGSERVLYAGSELPFRDQPAPRPHGGIWIGVGWALLIVGLFLSGCGVLAPAVTDPGSPAISDIVAARPAVLNPWKLPLIWGGAGVAQLGLTLLVVGTIVRAIYFLPGREVTRGELIGPSDVVTGGRATSS